MGWEGDAIVRNMRITSSSFCNSVKCYVAARMDIDIPRCDTHIWRAEPSPGSLLTAERLQGLS